MKWRKITDIMQLSCKHAWQTWSSTYSTYVLLQADSACKNVRNLVHDVVPWKRYVLQGTYLFGLIHHFWTVWPSSVYFLFLFFFFLVGLAVVHHPADLFHAELVCASAYIFVRTLIFTIVRAIVFSNRVHDRTNDLFGRSRVRTPGLAHNLLLLVQGLIPWPCSMIFLWVQGSIPGPDHLLQAHSIRGLCHSPPQLEDQVGLQKNKTSMRKKNPIKLGWQKKIKPQWKKKSCQAI